MENHVNVFFFKSPMYIAQVVQVSVFFFLFMRELIYGVKGNTQNPKKLERAKSSCSTVGRNRKKNMASFCDEKLQKLPVCLGSKVKVHITVEPRFNEVAGDRPNLFVKWRVCYIEVLFHTFYCNFGRGLR